MRDGMRTAGEFCAAATKIIEAAKNSAHKNTLTATLNDMVRWPVSATIASCRKRPEPLRGKRGTITQLVCVRQEQRAGKGGIDAGYVGKFRRGRVWQIFVFYLVMGDGGSNERAPKQMRNAKGKNARRQTRTRFTASFGCSGQTAAALEEQHERHSRTATVKGTTVPSAI